MVLIRVALAFILICFISNVNYGQDIIAIENDQMMLVKIESVDQEFIHYKKWKSDDAEVYKRDLVGVVYIKYENGRMLKFLDDVSVEDIVNPESRYEGSDYFLERGFVGKRYYHKGQRISKTEAMTALKQDTQLYNKYRNGELLNVLADITGGVSGYFLGFGTVERLREDVDVVGDGLYWLSIGGSLLSILLDNAAHKSMSNALESLGSDQSSSFNINMKVAPNGVGLTLNF